MEDEETQESPGKHAERMAWNESPFTREQRHTFEQLRAEALQNLESCASVSSDTLVRVASERFRMYDMCAKLLGGTDMRWGGQ